MRAHASSKEHEVDPRPLHIHTLAGLHLAQRKSGKGSRHLLIICKEGVLRNQALEKWAPKPCPHSCKPYLLIHLFSLVKAHGLVRWRHHIAHCRVKWGRCPVAWGKLADALSHFNRPQNHPLKSPLRIPVPACTHMGAGMHGGCWLAVASGTHGRHAGPAGGV